MLLGTTKRTLIQGVPSVLVSTPIRTSTLGAGEGSAMLLLAEVICCCFEHANCWPLCQKPRGTQLSGTWYMTTGRLVSQKTLTEVSISTQSAHTTRPLHASRLAGLYCSATARIPEEAYGGGADASDLYDPMNPGTCIPEIVRDIADRRVMLEFLPSLSNDAQRAGWRTMHPVTFDALKQCSWCAYKRWDRC